MSEYKPTLLDLFSGIGGFSLAFESVGFQTIGFAEIDPYASAVLRKHWPGVPNYGDISKHLEWPHLKPDVITGGFPCQPFSTASSGKRKGQNDDRFLWPKMRDAIIRFSPTWVLCENVAGFDKLGLETVVSDLEAISYEVAPPFEIPACGVGHDHRRIRLWILAHANRDREPISPIDEKMAELRWLHSDSRILGEANGISGGLDRNTLRCLGNSIVPRGRPNLRQWNLPNLEAGTTQLTPATAVTAFTFRGYSGGGLKDAD